MCGSPAVPNISAMPSEIVSSGFATSLPGASIPAPYFALAASNSASGFMWNRSSTRKARLAAPPKRSAAFTICTQVVASIPPKITYAIIAAPTIITAVS